MSTQLAGKGLIASIVLAISGAWLLEGHSWALNFAILALTFTAGGAVMLWKQRVLLRYLLPLVFMAAFGAMFVWRDAPELRFANLVGFGVALAIAASLNGSFANLRLYPGFYVLRLVESWLIIPAYAWYLAANDSGLSGSAPPHRRKQTMAALRGTLLALPIAGVFGGLLADADTVFRETLGTVVSFDVGTWISHGFVAAIVFVIAAGSYRLMIGPRRASSADQGVMPLEPMRLGITEVSIVLMSVIALFGVFCAVQFRYLFGGEQMIHAGGDLTYAEYARQGFFQLVWVAVLVMPLILVSRSLLDEQDLVAMSRFRILGSIAVGLVFVIMASAFTRMTLYVEAYGLTCLRVYTSVFMIWLALAFIWMLFTALARKPDAFGLGATLAGLVCIVGLNVINPDAMMARVNGSRSNPDHYHLSLLSADAAPDLLHLLRAMPKEVAEPIRALLIERWSEPSPWREMNLSRMQAVQAVNDYQLVSTP